MRPGLATKGSKVEGQNEVDLRECRTNVLARQLEVVEVEQALKASLRGVEEKTKHCAPLPGKR